MMQRETFQPMVPVLPAGFLGTARGGIFPLLSFSWPARANAEDRCQHEGRDRGGGKET
jgi:hypothetical protein